MKRPIFILSGAPASGKSTVARALLQHFSYGLHIPVDDLRGWVVAGLSDPIGSWDAETDRQFRLARQSAAAMARIYARAGFAVVIDDVIFPDQAAAHYDDALSAFEVHKVLLRPNLRVTLARNAGRHKEFDLSQLDAIIQPIHDAFDPRQLRDMGWHVVDSSHLTVADTVSEILDLRGVSYGDTADT